MTSVEVPATVREYLRVGRLRSASKPLYRRRLKRMWDAMTPAEREILNALWRDPS